MARLQLRRTVAASSALLLLGTAFALTVPGWAKRDGARERFVPAPTPKGGTVPPARERRESAEPPRRDPSKMKPPTGYRRLAVGGVATTGAGGAIVLVDASARRGLLLQTGGRDTFPVAAPSSPTGDRPLTRDLLYAAVKKLGGDVLSVRIDRLDDGVFHGSVLLTRGGRQFELEASPSDALSLAMGGTIPVFVEETVLARAGIDVEKFDFRRLHAKPDPVRAGGRAGEVEL